MRAVGLAIIALGVLVAVYATAMPVGAQEAAAATLGLSGSVLGDTINIGLLQNQRMTFDAGLMSCVVGAVIFAAGHIAAVLRRND